MKFYDKLRKKSNIRRDVRMKIEPLRGCKKFVGYLVNRPSLLVLSNYIEPSSVNHFFLAVIERESNSVGIHRYLFPLNN